MRVAIGRVVGNTVVLEEQLPEGASVEVVLRDGTSEPECDVTDAEWDQLQKAVEQVRRGEVTAAEVVMSKLRARK